jgi:hypothetical protein
MAQGAIISKPLARTESSRSPSLPTIVAQERKVSIRPLKEFAEQLSPDHPLRVVLLSEPDTINAGDYCVKLEVWLRLLPVDGR